MVKLHQDLNLVQILSLNRNNLDQDLGKLHLIMTQMTVDVMNLGMRLGFWEYSLRQPEMQMFNSVAKMLRLEETLLLGVIYHSSISDWLHIYFVSSLYDGD